MAGRVESRKAGSGQRDSGFALPEPEKLPILAVDDRPENLLTLEAVLAPPGFPIVTAASGEEAMALPMERDFALVFLDVRMPGLSGLCAELDDARLLVEVSEQGSGFEHAVRELHFDQVGGAASSWSTPTPAGGECTKAPPTCGSRSNAVGPAWRPTRRRKDNHAGELLATWPKAPVA